MLLFLLISTFGHAFTGVQTSTSVGIYRTYDQTNRYPFFHTWTLRGLYGAGNKLNLDFVLNNDFSLNQWHFLPTQANFEIVFSESWLSSPQKKSHATLGRQVFTEGFDFSFLDGVQTPLYWSNDGGVSFYGGALHTTDLEADADNPSSIGGFSIWERFFGFNLRGGMNAREDETSKTYGYGSIARSFLDLPLQPSFIHREEWDLNYNTYNQSYTDLQLQLWSTLSLTLAYSYLNPHPHQERNQNSFVYRLLSSTPTESKTVDLTWFINDSIYVSTSAQELKYNSGLKNESGSQYDLSAGLSTDSGQEYNASFTSINSYGGHLNDLGLQFAQEIGDKSKINLEYSVGYLRKINKIEGWVQHARIGFETFFINRLKTLIACEAERNQYFQFDARTMVYVTNYL